MSGANKTSRFFCHEEPSSEVSSSMHASGVGLVDEDRSGTVLLTPSGGTNGDALTSRRSGGAVNASDVIQMETMRAELSRKDGMV